MISMALMLGLQLGGEPSIVPELIMPRAKNRRLLPGRGWDVKLPRDFQVVGEDPATLTLNLRVVINQTNACQLQLISRQLPLGNAGSLALSATPRLRKLPGVRLQNTRKLGQGLLRQGAIYQPLNNPALSRFVVEWYRVERGAAVIAALEGPAGLSQACEAKTMALIVDLKRMQVADP
tara:strand:+ start:190 stop:723 length:534 start_codon:yes stop_codon:yes gene_type:complete